MWKPFRELNVADRTILPTLSQIASGIRPPVLPDLDWDKNRICMEDFCKAVLEN